MMTLQHLTPRDYLDIALRRKWVILGSILLSLAIAWGLCLILPKSYRSSTLILVESPKIPESYVNPVIRGTVADRLSMIQQQVMSRTVLSHVIEEFRLYPERVKQEGLEVVLEAMRKNIKIETKGGTHIEAFSISFSHSDPVTAMKVTQYLASQFIDENLKVREQLVEGTTEFLEQELQRAKASLEEQESAIAQFKKKYMGELPGQTEANLHTLGRLQKDLATVNDQLQNRKDRRAAIQKMINAYETLGLTFLETAPSGSKPHDNVQQSVVVRNTARKSDLNALDPLAVRLKELERLLASLTAEYKDTYPDVIQVKQEIAAVKAKLSEKYEKDNEKDKDNSQEPMIQVTTKPGKPSGGTVIDPYLHELRREREENEIGIAALMEQQRKLTAQIREYEQRVERAPAREQELLVLQRDYDNTKRNYQALLEKQLNARISENLEKRQKGENFRVLDPANLPTKPESPDQLKIILGGLVLGGGLGCGAALGLEFLAGVFRRPEDVESLLGLPVLAAIPHFKTAYPQGHSLPLPEHPNHLLEGAKNPKTGHPALLTNISFDNSRAKRTLHPWHKPAGQDGKFAWAWEGSRTEIFKQELTLVAKWRPTSLVAEQFRVAATRLVLSSSGQKNMVVVVTSAVKGEGKSATASNLAYVLAQDLGKPTLLIDCDFKKPTVHAYTGVPSKPGLVEALYGDTAVEGCLHRSGDLSLWVLPSGRREHRLVDLTKIPQVSSMIAELRNRFDFIIIDGPPILPLADMNLLGALADMIILVIRAGETRQEVVQTALKNLKPPSRAGIILTCPDDTTGPRYMQEYYKAAKESYLR